MEGSSIAHRVAFQSNVRIPTRDGLELAGDLYQPADRDGQSTADRYPTIIERSPYHRSREVYRRYGNYFACRGYNWLVVDSRGRGDSDGEFNFYNPHHEGFDGYDVIEWSATQPWSDGKVGTMGISQCGMNQQAAAIMRPPHLTTQIVMDCGINYYHRPVRNNGAFADAIFAPYAISMAISGKEAAADPMIKRALERFLDDAPNWIHRLPLRRGETPLALAPSYERWYFNLATQGDYNDMYRNPMCNLGEYIDNYPDIPLCFTSSWYGNRHGWGNFEKFNILRKKNASPVHLLVGPWEHRFEFMEQASYGDIAFGNDVRLNLNDFQLRWFDQFLKGMDTGVLDQSSARIWVMGGGSGCRDLDRRMQHGGAWKNISAWPLPDAQSTTYYLTRNGSLDLAQPAADIGPLGYVFDPSNPVPTIGGGLQGEGGISKIVHGGGFDQRASDYSPLSSRPDVLVFRTPVLEEDVEVTGEVNVDLYIRSSAPDTDFTAKLVDEYPPSADYPNGYALNLVDDIVRLSYRDGRLSRELCEPGKIYRVRVGQMVISNLFKKGHRIRLDISSSSFPQFDVNPNTGAPFDQVRGRVTAFNEVFVDAHHASAVLLPIVKRGRR